MITTVFLCKGPSIQTGLWMRQMTMKTEWRHYTQAAKEAGESGRSRDLKHRRTLHGPTDATFPETERVRRQSLPRVSLVSEVQQCCPALPSSALHSHSTNLNRRTVTGACHPNPCTCWVRQRQQQVFTEQQSLHSQHTAQRVQTQCMFYIITSFIYKWLDIEISGYKHSLLVRVKYLGCFVLLLYKY